MNKQLIATICILGLVGMVVGVIAQGATEDTVTATVTPGVVSVDVTPATFDYGYMTLNTSKTSHEAGQTSGITANVGTVHTDLNIRGANALGDPTGTWTLAGSTGSDIYVHEFGAGADPGSWTALTTSNATLTIGVTPSGSYIFGLRITTPTASTVVDEYSAPVTVVASWGG